MDSSLCLLENYLLQPSKAKGTTDNRLEPSWLITLYVVSRFCECSFCTLVAILLINSWEPVS